MHACMPEGLTCTRANPFPNKPLINSRRYSDTFYPLFDTVRICFVTAT